MTMPANGILPHARCGRRLALDPADAEALQHLAAHGWLAADGLTALRWFRRAARIHRDRSTLDGQVKALLPVVLSQLSIWIDQGRIDAAGDALQELATLGVPSPDLFRMLGTVRLIQGRDSEAGGLRGRSEPGTGYGVALAAVEEQRIETAILGTVVIPAHAAETTIEAALDSVLAAIRHYRRAADPQALVHIRVVDDASPDGTVDAVRRWGRAHPEQSLALVALNRNGGAGHARNAGAAGAPGELLWFLDADDVFLERHLLRTAEILRHHPQLGFVRTGILFDGIDATITPAWRAASENSYPCNLCVRRACHDRIGGFPEEAPFRPAVAEDVAYARALSSLFAGAKIDEKTVRYTLQPGNVLSRMRETMTGPTAPAAAATTDSRFMAIEILTRRRLYALDRSRSQSWHGPPLLPATGAPTAVRQPDGAEALLALAGRWCDQGRHADASELLTAAARALPGRTDLPVAAARSWLRAEDLERAREVLRAAPFAAPGLAEAWFDLGVAAHGAQRPDLALAAFRTAAWHRPDLAVAHFNAGTLLLQAEAPAAAAARLRMALMLQPDHAGTLFLLGRLARQRGAMAEARALLARAVRLAPSRAEILAEHSGALLDLGQFEAALKMGRRAAAAAPQSYEAHAAVGAGLEALGQAPDALAAWERAIECNPGYGEAFTRRSVLLLAQRWGPAPIRPASGRPGRRLAATGLGRHGRFGNQLLQYGFLRLYADRHDLDLEVPPWPGRHLYDHDDPLPGSPLPAVSETQADLVGSLLGETPDIYAEHDLAGYFCGDTGRLSRFREPFRRLFVPGRHLRSYADGALARLRAAGRTAVALHIRRGDFGWGPFWTAPEAWYLRWLEAIWPTLDQPVLYLATDDPACARAFADYRPLVAADVAEPLPGAEFFTDFHLLCHADHLAISNSTFSFVASMLNRNAASFLRPDRARQELVSFDPWNAPVLL
ncbi:MAG TPA: glycosyltransferase [Azospirillaceae bacterium]|nr:glycosyltransferase [Azospirillaceae bacterium]